MTTLAANVGSHFLRRSAQGRYETFVRLTTLGLERAVSDFFLAAIRIRIIIAL